MLPDQKRQRRRSKSQKAAHDQLRADYQWLMQSKAGRRLVWLWLERAGIYRTTFTGTRQGDFLEGRRSNGLELVADIQTFAADLYLLMANENRPRPEVTNRDQDDSTEHDDTDPE